MEVSRSDDAKWLLDLPYTLSLPNFRAFVVHAGLVPGVELAKQNPFNMTRMRNALLRPITSSAGKAGTYEAFDGTKKGDAWASLWTQDQADEFIDGFVLYFGHDAKRGLQQYSYAVGLDTGCCYGKYKPPLWFIVC